MNSRHGPTATDLSNCLICMGGQETESIDRVREILPYALECNIDYFTSVMSELATRLNGFDQYTFVFTRSVTELPVQFDDTDKLVVLVMGDEWARVPSYANRCLAVFKAPGQHMKLALHRRWPRFNAMAVVQYLRQQSKRFPKHHKNPENNIYAIPYGYYRLPRRQNVAPINTRSIVKRRNSTNGGG